MLLRGDETKLLVPTSPWLVRGNALIIIGHLSRRGARTLAGQPRGLLAPPLLGTVAAMGIIDYTETPVGPYHEVTVSPGVLWRDLPGALVSHMLVDNLRSRLAGRAIWGLPKELARFQWGVGHAAVTDMDDQPLIAATWRARGGWPSLPLPPLPVMAQRGPRCQVFTVGGALGHVTRVRATLAIPKVSGFAPLARLARGPHLALYIEGFRLRIGNAYDLP